PRRPRCSPALTFAASAASFMVATISLATSSGPPSVGVGRLAWPSTWLSASTTTVWILVPPRSIPPRGAWSEPGLTWQTLTSGFDKIFGVKGDELPLVLLYEVPQLWDADRENLANDRYTVRGTVHELVPPID